MRTVAAVDRGGRAENELAGVVPGNIVELRGGSWGRGRSVVLPWFVKEQDCGNNRRVGER